MEKDHWENWHEYHSQLSSSFWLKRSVGSPSRSALSGNDTVAKQTSRHPHPQYAILLKINSCCIVNHLLTKRATRSNVSGSAFVNEPYHLFSFFVASKRNKCLHAQRHSLAYQLSLTYQRRGFAFCHSKSFFIIFFLIFSSCFGNHGCLRASRGHTTNDHVSRCRLRPTGDFMIVAQRSPPFCYDQCLLCPLSIPLWGALVAVVSAVRRWSMTEWPCQARKISG